MYLIVMHQLEEYSKFIEGFSGKYNCITLWSGAYDAGGLMITDVPFFTYTATTRVRRYTHPFG